MCALGSIISIFSATRTHTYTQSNTSTYIHIYSHSCVNTHTRIHTHLHSHTHTYAYSQTFEHTHAHTHSYTCITHVHTRVSTLQVLHRHSLLLLPLRVLLRMFRPAPTYLLISNNWARAMASSLGGRLMQGA